MEIERQDHKIMSPIYNSKNQTEYRRMADGLNKSSKNPTNKKKDKFSVKDSQMLELEPDTQEYVPSKDNMEIEEQDQEMITPNYNPVNYNPIYQTEYRRMADGLNKSSQLKK